MIDWGEGDLVKNTSSYYARSTGIAFPRSIMLQKEQWFAISLKNREFAMKENDDSLFAAISLFSRIFEKITN
ncbi:hypothetical protein ASG85_06905 [Paenibacillus sp. Soil724D2]|nr:hypothetical protein ASG85_06905 [Paenibacillus sp. Soil724D2]